MLACWTVRLTVDGKRTPPIKMPGITREDEERAKYMGKVMSKRYRAVGAVPETSRETVNEWFEKWVEAREDKGLSSTANDRGRFNKWISPTIGTKAMGGRHATRYRTSGAGARSSRA